MIQTLLKYSLLFWSFFITARAEMSRPHSDQVKALYMTSWVAGRVDLRYALMELIKKSEINALVIDVKDYSGNVSFNTDDPDIEGLRSSPVRCKDMALFIEQLHQMGVYVIARMTVFQDPSYAARRPSEAIQSKARKKPWLDFKGLAYIDPASRLFWHYIVQLSKACQRVGFDEINYDYIRFPSDGKLDDMDFVVSNPEMAGMPATQFLVFQPRKGGVVYDRKTKLEERDRTQSWVQASPKAFILENFFIHLYQEVRQKLNMPTSADLFGMTLTVQRDWHIGQLLEVAAPYFDYIAPMIYPSHYPKGFQGFQNPAKHPYQVIHFVLKEGKRRLERLGYSVKKLRPWLQDFDLCALYDVQKVQAQKKAVYDVGLQGWMIWNPRNRYQLEKYLKAAHVS